MRAHHLLIAGLIASAVATSALAQGKGRAGSASIPSQGIDFKGASGGDHGAAAGIQSGLKSGYASPGSGLSAGASALPPLSPPPPSSETGYGPPGPPGRPIPGSRAVQP